MGTREWKKGSNGKSEWKWKEKKTMEKERVKERGSVNETWKKEETEDRRKQNECESKGETGSKREGMEHVVSIMSVTFASEKMAPCLEAHFMV